MKRTVFISHSSQDKKIADAVCNFLEKHGVLCWIAPRDITPGKNYGAAIIDAISECEFFVLILSSLSNDSQQVVREVERAASTQSVVIPLRVEAVQPSKDLQFYVSSSHWLDAVTPPLDQHLLELLRAIEGWKKDEGQRRRRTPQPVENVATVAALETPAPAAVPVKKRPGVWLYAVAATTILVVCASVLLLKRSSSTTPTNREDSAALATRSPSAVAAEASPPQVASSTPLVANIGLGQVVEVKNLTSTEYQEKFNELTQQGYRPIKVWAEALAGREQPSFGYWATFQKVSNRTPWVARYGLDAVTYQQEFDKCVAQGYMPTYVNVACVNNVVRYCVIYDKIVNPPAWVAKHNINKAQFDKEHEDLVAKGFKLKIRSSCSTGADWIYAALWQKD